MELLFIQMGVLKCCWKSFDFRMFQTVPTVKTDGRQHMMLEGWLLHVFVCHVWTPLMREKGFRRRKSIDSLSQCRFTLTFKALVQTVVLFSSEALAQYWAIRLLPYPHMFLLLFHYETLLRAKLEIAHVLYALLAGWIVQSISSKVRKPH